jgi:hypothetical protein
MKLKSPAFEANNKLANSNFVKNKLKVKFIDFYGTDYPKMPKSKKK